MQLNISHPRETYDQKESHNTQSYKHLECTHKVLARLEIIQVQILVHVIDVSAATDKVTSAWLWTLSRFPSLMQYRCYVFDTLEKSVHVVVQIMLISIG